MGQPVRLASHRNPSQPVSASPGSSSSRAATASHCRLHIGTLHCSRGPMFRPATVRLQVRGISIRLPQGTELRICDQQIPPPWLGSGCLQHAGPGTSRPSHMQVGTRNPTIDIGFRNILAENVIFSWITSMLCSPRYHGHGNRLAKNREPPAPNSKWPI
jgi:hypothetical protein